MASVAKYTARQGAQILRHNERTIQNPKNKDIDKNKTHLNYSLLDREEQGYKYFKKRKADPDLYCFRRSDVKEICGWIITKPKQLPPEHEQRFFQESYNYLVKKFGGTNCENVLSAIVHKDEATPHLHFLFIPVVADGKRGGEKISAKEKLSKAVLREVHPELQEHLNRAGVPARVHSGITAEQGGNRTVKELKQDKPLKLNIRQTSREKGVFINREDDNR